MFILNIIFFSFVLCRIKIGITNYSIGKVQEKCEICVRSKEQKNLKESVGNKLRRKYPIEIQDH